MLKCDKFWISDLTRIELRFFKCFFPLWKIVKNSVVSNDDFFVMGDDNVKRKKYFPKDNGLSWKAFRNENVDERGGSSSNFFFSKTWPFWHSLLEITNDQLRQIFFLGKKIGIFYWKTWNFFWPISLHILSVLGKVFEGKYRLGKCEECEIVTCCDIETYCLVFTVFLKRFLSNVTNWLVFLQKLVENWNYI